MIPKIIHYCWFGRGAMSEMAQKCLASWRQYMPDYEYKLWNEDNFDVNSMPYTKEAYDMKKYAFVSDYVRLWALCNEGGLYMDVDFVVFKPFDELLSCKAFAGFEGSKTNPVMMGVIASEPKGEWVTLMRNAYQGRHFLNEDGSFDLTTNVRFVTDIMMTNGFIANGKEQDYMDLHVFPVDYFCPRLTTGEYRKTERTYCDSIGVSSWCETRSKYDWLRFIGEKNFTRLIKLKRKLFG